MVEDYIPHGSQELTAFEPGIEVSFRVQRLLHRSRINVGVDVSKPLM